MKTAISIPDDVFEAADLAARELGVSRSELYVKAVREYLMHHSADDVTERLNAVYGEGKDEGLDPSLVRLQSLSLAQEDWG